MRREPLPVPKIQTGQRFGKRSGMMGAMNSPLPSIVDININKKASASTRRAGAAKSDALSLTSLNSGNSAQSVNGRNNNGSGSGNGFANTLAAPSMVGVNPDKLSRMAEPLIYADKKHIIPGIVPYKVALERRKRELAKETLAGNLLKHNITVGLDSKGIDLKSPESYDKSLPSIVGQNTLQFENNMEFDGVNTEKYVSSPLPLTLFDFGLEEIRSPYKWAKYSKQIDQNSGVSLNSKQRVLYGECLADPQFEISEDGKFINQQIHINSKDPQSKTHKSAQYVQWKNCVITRFVFLNIGEHKIQNTKNSRNNENRNENEVFREDNTIDFNDFVNKQSYPPDNINTNGKAMFAECILRTQNDNADNNNNNNNNEDRDIYNDNRDDRNNMKIKRYLLPRVLVFLWGESGEDFAIRLRRCLEFRILTEQRIRLKLFISGMPTEGLLAISNTSINKIRSEVIPLLPDNYTLEGLGRASTKTSISLANSKLETFIDDMIKEHLTTQNSIIMKKYISGVGEAEAKELNVEKAMWWEQHKEELQGTDETSKNSNLSEISIFRGKDLGTSYKERMNEILKTYGSLPWWWYVDTKPAFEHISNSRPTNIEKTNNFKSSKSLFELTTLFCGKRPIFALLHTQNECWKATRCYPVQKDIRNIVTQEETNDPEFPFKPYKPVPIPVHCIYAIPGATIGQGEGTQSMSNKYMANDAGDSTSLFNQSLSSDEKFMLNPVPAHTVKTLSLTDFINFNNNKITSEKAFISDILINYIKQKITVDLNNVAPGEDKGWFNLDISNFDVYNTGKLKRLLMRVNFMIGQCVREIVEKSTAAYRDALRAGIDWKVKIVNECIVDNHHRDNRAWWVLPGDEMLEDRELEIKDQDKPKEERQRCLCLRRGPVFNIDIIIESIQAGEIEYREMQSLEIEYSRLDDMKNRIKKIISSDDNQDNANKEENEEEQAVKPQTARGNTTHRAGSDQDTNKTGGKNDKKSARGKKTQRTERGGNKGNNQQEEDDNALDIPDDTLCPTILFNVSPSDYLSASLSILQENIRQLYRIETIEPALMQNLLWPPSNNSNNNSTFISCPRVEEKFVQDTIQDIKLSFESAIDSLELYKKTFTCYNRIIILDVQKWKEIIRCRAIMGISEENKNTEPDKSNDRQGPANTNIPICKNGEYTEAKDQTITNFSLSSPLKCSELFELYSMLITEHARISLRIPDIIHVGMFIVNNKGIKQHILAKRKQMADSIVDIIKEIAEMQSNKLIDEFNNIVLRIKRKNKEIEDVVEIEDTLNNIGEIEDKLKSSIDVVNRYYSLLDKISASLTGESFKLRYKTFSLIKQLGEQIIQSREILENDRTKFKENQKNQQVDFLKQIEQISRQTSTFPQRHVITYLTSEDTGGYEDQDINGQSPKSQQGTGLFGQKEVDLANINATCDESEMLFRQLRRMDEQAKLFNKREIIFGTEYTDYKQLYTVIKDFEPVYTLWKTIGTWYNNYNQWIHGPLTNVKPEVVDRIVNETFRSLSKSIRSFKKMPALADMATKVKDEVSVFKLYTQLITAMCNPGMRYCHWKQLSEQIGMDIYPTGKRNEEVEEEDEESIDESTKAELLAAQYDDEGKYIGYTLQTAISTGLNNQKYLSQIQNISDIASKEYSIETALASIKQAWDANTMNIIEYDTGGGNAAAQMGETTITYLLKGSDDLIQMIDDHSVLVQSMSFSPFKKRFEKTIHKWEVNLNLAGDILEEWLMVQQNWLYLEPIFSSEDIQKQLPNEAKNFKTVDHQWRKMMLDAYRAKNLMKFISGVSVNIQSGEDDEAAKKKQKAAFQGNVNAEKLLGKLKANSELLEKIQKGLSDYIDMKRQLFPRFYFLSSDELLEILSQTKNPKAVQPFLRSCFENIQYVIFNETDSNDNKGGNNDEEGSTKLSMDSMVSLEGEVVDFERPVLPEGNVETWMKSLEHMMLTTVKQCIRRGYESYRDIQLSNSSDPESKWRCDWVLDHPAQVVLCVTQIFFAIAIETALNEEGYEGLKKVVNVVQKQLLDLAELSGTNLTKLESKTMSSLLTIEVHARDILDQLLTQNVQNPGDFGWMSLLRYYYVYDDKYDPESTVASRRECKDCVVVKQVQTEWLYGYEYLGNTSRLVITPLTDRIYMTLMGALHLNLGGAPAGPAGTGKTETTKDLGKALAMAVIVFNCSDGLDYLSMGRFFTGLSMCGAWSCFDEFNRIDIEVLSVIAQQVLTIQQAIINVCAEAAANLPKGGSSHPIVGNGKFIFEGKEITIKSTCAVFITMNPGYAGRTELPDNLQALFRPVACSVPDYELIARVRLFSFGFKCAKNLSVKTTLTFRLSSEQLSSQDHYDFGMRALNTTLVAAGNRIKEAQSEAQGKISELQEQQIMLRALLEVNTPKFLDQDVVLFNNIISDMFPGIPRQKVDYGALEKELRLACIRLGYDFNDKMIGWSDADKDEENSRFISKCIELYQTIELRHGLMTVGPTMSGKSAALMVLKNALDTLGRNATADSQYIPANIFRLNPKSITMGQLYGQYDLTTHEWTDGILANLVRKAVHMGGVGTGGVAAPPSFRWIVFDGPVDALWIENMNTVLDDNKKLCLTSGEIIAMNNHMNMIFEVGDLAVASPATVSRCGMIYFSNETVHSNCMIGSYLGRIRGLLGYVKKGSNDRAGMNMNANAAGGFKLNINNTNSNGGTNMNAGQGNNDNGKSTQNENGENNEETGPKIDLTDFQSCLDNSLSLCAYLFRLVPTCIKFVRTGSADGMDAEAIPIKEYIKSEDRNLLVSFFNMFESNLIDINKININKFNLSDTSNPYIYDSIEADSQYLIDIFIFSLIYSVGNTCVPEDRKRLSEFIVDLLIKEIIEKGQDKIDSGSGCIELLKYLQANPDSGLTLYDFVFLVCTVTEQVEEGEETTTKIVPKWVHWNTINAGDIKLDRDINEEIKLNSSNENNKKDFINRSYLESIKGQQLSYNELLIPTGDTIRCKYIIDKLIKGGKNVLAVGPTGTSKSSLLNQYLLAGGYCSDIDINTMLKDVVLSENDKKKRMLDIEEQTGRFIPITFSFSAQTSANQLQDFVDEKLEKRRKGVFGPPNGKRFLLFIDDTNMPQKEVYFAQPPIELLRQMVDHGGWYDRKTLQFKHIVDTQVIGAMGPVGGGRTDITARFSRHFNYISFAEMNEESLRTIFSSVMQWWITTGDMEKVSVGISFTDIISNTIGATVELYNRIKKELLPIPAKSHYTFNLRDISKVFQGIVTADTAGLFSIENNNKIASWSSTYIRLWVHECTRVFSDRLVNNEDRTWFHKNISEMITDYFNSTYDKIIEERELLVPQYEARFSKGGDDGHHDDNDQDKQQQAISSGLGDSILFGDYMFPNDDKKLYSEIRSLKRMSNVVVEFLDDYNSQTKQPMPLVMFLNAMEHVTRILRILRQPGGHALLLGIGGSGRQSLTRLAAHIADFETKQIEISKTYGVREWRDDLKGVLLTAGLEDKDVVFLIVDTQLIHSTMLEDINMVLNTGDIPNLYEPAELDSINQTYESVCRNKGIQPTKLNIFYQYLNKVKSKLHIVLAMSPMSNSFKDQIRMFPSLVNCCTIDWFTEWPDDALKSVAKDALIDVDFGVSSDNNTGKNNDNEDEDAGTERRHRNSEMLKKIVSICVQIHQSVFKASDLYLTQVRRVSHVTPTKYLELLASFVALEEKLRREINMNIMRLSGGLEKLATTATQVTTMQAELSELQPQLLKTSEEVDKMMQQVQQDTAKAEEAREVVSKEEAVASAKAKECAEIKEDAERDLAEALPALEVAVKALKLLSKSDLTEIRSFLNPPAGVKLCMEAVCIMFDLKPKIVDDPKKVGAKMEDYWSVSRNLLSDPTVFLNSLFDYDKDNIKPNVIKSVTKYVNDTENFTPKAMERVSKAASGLCAWVLAMHKYYFVSLAVAPKREKLAAAEKDFDEINAKLSETKQRLAQVEAQLSSLQQEYDRNVAEKENLGKKVDECEARLRRAEELLGGLGGEKDRWEAGLASWREREKCVIGDAIIGAASVSYLGVFTSEFRENLIHEWMKYLSDVGVQFTALEESGQGAYVPPTITTLCDAVTIQGWGVLGLPTDNVSIENTILMTHSSRYPMLIDPQEQAQKFIRRLDAEKGIDVVKATDKDLLRTLENCIRFGRSMMILNCSETLDPTLEPVLLKQTFKQAGSDVISIGDQVIPFNQTFMLYLVTGNPNPRFAPETMARVNVLNFTVTPGGLEDQLLGTVVSKERPDLEEAKTKTVTSIAHMRQDLKDTENKILKMLAESTGNILDDEALISTLSESKAKSSEVTEKVKSAETTEKMIDTTREGYRPVAKRASVLYFCISGMKEVDPMYEYSLQWFMNVFVTSLTTATDTSTDAQPTSEEEILNRRLNLLNNHFTYMLYNTVCRSLFEKHKTLFSFMLAVRIKQGLETEEEKEAIKNGNKDYMRTIPPNYLSFFLHGTMRSSSEKPNPIQHISEQTWIEVETLASIGGHFTGLDDSFCDPNDRKLWEDVCLSDTPYQCKLPRNFEKTIAGRNENGEYITGEIPFMLLMLIKTLRPEKLLQLVTLYITNSLGRQFIEPPTFDLGLSYRDTNPGTPLLFVLSSGADPTAALARFSEEMRMSRKYVSISLGQGQGERAERMINNGAEKGMWVLLANCHLALSWMGKLEAIVERLQASMNNNDSITQTIHKDFRLFMTSMPTPKFPISILQNSIKVTNEPPNGLRSNLLRTYSNFDDKYINESVQNSNSQSSNVIPKTVVFRRLLYSLCAFHAVIQDRRKYGPLAFNIPYGFTDGDLDVCLRQMKMLIDDYKEPTDGSEPSIPFTQLRFLTGVINYGGRITDYHDQHTLNCILEDYVSHDSVYVQNYKFSRDEDFINPAIGANNTSASVHDYINAIKKLPLEPSPTVFGFSNNADITYSQRQGGELIDCIMNIEGSGGSEESSSSASIIEHLLRITPKAFDVQHVAQLFPTDYTNSMNTVVVQECQRYNKLTSNMRKSLQELIKALAGVVVMSGELDAVMNSINANRTPADWLRFSFPSLKPLNLYMVELEERVAFISSWVSIGEDRARNQEDKRPNYPPIFFISRLFFPQAFLTGIQQNHARKYKLAIDTLKFGFKFRDEIHDGSDGHQASVDYVEEGVLITGLYFEGASWDYSKHMIMDPKPRELFCYSPPIQLMVHQKKMENGVEVEETIESTSETQIYKCPVYKTTNRAGVLSTTGHSTNFIFEIDVPTTVNPHEWTKAGVAMFCALEK